MFPYLRYIISTPIANVEQQLYTYDMPTIFGRFQEILFQLNNPESETKYDVSLSRMEILFFELDNLVAPNFCQVNSLANCSTFSDILKREDFLTILNREDVINIISKYKVNPNKWIRLRKTNDKITIATKHILADDDSGIQQLLETEINVESFEGANDLLKQLGFIFKSYQEKRRITYILENHEVDIDFWSNIPPYLEVEGSSKEDIESILKLLEHNIDDTVSCTADEIYRMYGKSMFDSRELKFE